GHEAITFRNDHIVNLLTHNRQDYFKETLPDYVVFTDKDIYLAKQIELLGVPVFNSAETIEISDDKIKTYQYVSKQQLPIPKTIVAPKTFGIHSTLSDSFIDEVIEELGFPLVMKEAFGSFGEQVYLIHHRRELENYIEKLSKVPYLFQQFIET